MTNEKTVQVVMLLYGMVFLSPMFTQEGAGKYIIIFLGLIILALALRGMKVRKGAVIISLLLLVTAVVSSAYWQSPGVVLSSAWLLLAVLIAGISSNDDLRVFANVGANFILLLLFGALIGLAWVMLGNGPITSITNLDGRENYIFPVTLSNAYLDNYIRPSGIYDEPGALSFVVCSIVLIRMNLGIRDLKNTVILMLGFITLSLAHFVFVVFYFLSIFRVKKAGLAALLFGIVSVFSTSLGDDNYISKFIERVSAVITLDQATAAGVNINLDNRESYFTNSLNIIEREDFSVLFGLDYSCIFSSTCGDKVSPICCEPLTPFVTGGLFNSWAFYLVLLLCICAPFKYGPQGLATFGYALLIMQRPNLYQNGYALLITLVVCTLFRGLENNVPKNKYSDSGL